MKKFALVALLLSCIVARPMAQPHEKKAIFVIVDGIPADVIEKVETPVLDNIAKEGVYLHAHVGGEKNTYTQTPTISAVGYNSLLTGTWVNKHNVWDNDIAEPNYSYPTIFRLFKNQYPTGKTAIFSTWLDNRTKLVGEGLEETDHIQLDYHYDSLEYDTIRFPHVKESAYTHMIDEEVVNAATTYIRKEAPVLSWVYLEYTDDMGHRYGDSEQFYDAVKMMDDQIRRLWEAVQFRQRHFDEDWVIYITTDHGRNAETGKNHGGQSDRERNTWIVTNAKNIDRWFLKNPPGIVDIMPTIAAWLNIAIPKETLMEIDGVSLTGKVAAYDLQASYADNKLNISWKSVDKKSKAKIWLATTNEFKSGGKDKYELMKELPLSDGKAVVDVSKMPSDFYKVVLETSQGFLNRWVILKR